MSSSDLTTLAQVQNWAGGIASNTSQIAALIPAISNQILGILCRQSVLPVLYTETTDGMGTSSIFLRQYPVQSVSSVVISGELIPAATPNAASVANTYGWVLGSSDIYPPGKPQKLSLRQRCFWRGIQNVTVSYIAGYQVNGEAWTVPASPYQVTARQVLGAWGSDGGVTYTNGTALVAVASSPTHGQYSVSAGVYTFSAADSGASILISYGYIPQSLALACAMWVAESVSYSGRIGVKSKTLGGQETMAYDVSSIPSRVDLLIQPYKRVAIL